MRAEIIAVGSELLLGDIVNTNASWLSEQLAVIGVDVFHHVSVGDNPARIQKVIEQAIERADVLIFTGGLGPTQDDLTVETIADYFKVPLISDPESERMIEAFFIARGMTHAKSNLKQALRPADAQVIANPIGTAPGICWDVSEKTGRETFILTFPGVPRELYQMWGYGKRFIQEKQQERGEQHQMLVSSSLHFFGIGESTLGEELADLMESSNPTVAPYVGRSEVRVRLAAKANTEADALALIQPIKSEIAQRLKPFYFGEGDEASLEESVAVLLLEQGLRVSTAESCTGGLVSSRLTDVSGSSEYTTLNVVTYSNEEKMKVLGVSVETLEQHGAVSPQTAQEMAEGIRRLSGADIGLSMTGIAGPTGGNEEKPVGLVYMGLSGPINSEGQDTRKTIVKKIMVNRNYKRMDIKYWFSQYALHYLRHYLLGTLRADEDSCELKPSASPVSNN